MEIDEQYQMTNSAREHEIKIKKMYLKFDGYDREETYFFLVHSV